MRLEEQGPTREDEEAAELAAEVDAHERIEEAKALAALTPAECDAAYRVIFAGTADPRHPYRWNP